MPDGSEPLAFPIDEQATADRAAAEAELEAMLAQAQAAPRPMTMVDILQNATLPPNGTPIQLIACPHCQQPMILALGQAAGGGFVPFPYCFNSLCAGKRGIVPASGASLFQQLPPPPGQRR